jgi:two-component system, sensor histidine kinase
MKASSFAADEGFDGVAAASRGLLPARLVVAGIVVAMVSTVLGAHKALAWGAALACAEAFTWFATAPHERGGPLTARDRATYFASALCVNASWLGLSLLFWFHPQPASAFLALLTWMALFLNAISHAFRSGLALLVFATPTSFVMVGAPLLFPRFEGAWQVFAVAGLVICAGYAAISARRNVMAAESLAEALAELERRQDAAGSRPPGVR